jgi:SAM-dependent methyltransferase
MTRPTNLLLRARRRLKYWRQCRLQPWRVVTHGEIRVHYKECLDGGGASFGQDFIPLFRRRGMPKQERVFEWCAGPGFIGFTMLGHDQCETLCLSDINPVAVKACQRTIADNNLGERVSVYCSNNLAGIALDEQWDLIVGNPPHFDHAAFDLRSNDLCWRVHREFFDHVDRFLRPGGVIVLQESNLGSTAETFREMLAAANLTIVFIDRGKPDLAPEEGYYHLGITRRGDPTPPWARASA